MRASKAGVSSKTLEERFWDKVDRRGPNDCWVWKAWISKRGYGGINVDGKCRQAHRVAFLLTHGHWPEPLGCHSCDNRPCCNPDHIFEGTAADNTADMLSKGRHRALSGERKPNAKLTDDQARDIRAMSGSVTRAEMARRYGVSFRVVDNIVKGRAWVHVL